jgi:hypothetical protein
MAWEVAVAVMVHRLARKAEAHDDKQPQADTLHFKGRSSAALSSRRLASGNKVQQTTISAAIAVTSSSTAAAEADRGLLLVS